MYQVIGHPRTRTMRVYWMLEELGRDYEIIIAPAHSPAAMAANPSGKVPALNVNGDVVTDSVAIMQFLADRHGALTYPCGSIERAQQDSFTQFGNDEMDSVLWAATKHKSYYPTHLQVPAAIESSRHDFANAITTLTARLGNNEFVMGDKLTVPDILLAHCAGWAKGFGFDLPDGKLGDYFKRLRSRRAFKQAMVKSAKLT